MNYYERAKYFRTKKRLGQNFLIDGQTISDIIDFAGISEYRYLKNVIDFLQQELQKDVIKTICFGLSRGGNVEIVRMRRRPTLRDILTEECQSCLGTGRVEK